MDSIYFSLYNLQPVVWICAVVAVAAMLWLLSVYRGRVVSVSDAAAGDVDEPDDAAFPPVSIIVHANDNAGALGAFLPEIFRQDYPAPFEVIVVNDGSAEDVRDLVDRLSLQYRNLYQTFVPEQAHNLSRKKLGISLGIKAARNPYVILTCAECRVASDRWLRFMATPFAKGKDVSLGFARIDGLGGMKNRYDEAATAVKWLSEALAGKPYRGIGYNIGYSRALFFEAKGFSRSLTFHYGDDDLFINQIATGGNTGVVLDPGSVLAVEWHDPRRLLRDLRMRHCFTERFLPKGASRFFAFSTIMLWIWLGAVVTGIVFSLPNALPACFFAALVPALWIPLVKAWRNAGAVLGIGLPAWRLPFAMMGRWRRSLNYGLRCGRTSRRNYTWLQK